MNFSSGLARLSQAYSQERGLSTLSHSHSADHFLKCITFGD